MQYDNYTGGDHDLRWGEEWRLNKDTTVSDTVKNDTFNQRKN